MNHNLTSAIAAVTNNTLSSVYTKDDVLTLLNSITQSPEVDIENLIEVIDKSITNQLDRASSSDLFDFDDCELSLDYNNKVVVESVAYDSNCIAGVALKNIHIALNEYFNPTILEKVSNEL